MTEVLLLLVAVLLSLACGVFVAAEFSLTTSSAATWSARSSAANEAPPAR